MGTTTAVVVSKLSVKMDPLEIQHPKLEKKKAWSIVTVKMTENVVFCCCCCCCFLFCFVVFSFMSHVYVLSLICLFIISGEFDALHQLSVKKDPLEIQLQSLKQQTRF